MPLYSIVAKDRPEGFAHRRTVRPEHLKHLESLGDKLLLAGPFQDEESRSTGSFMLIEAADLAAARALFARDPYVVREVFESYEISRFNLTINKTAGR